MALGTKLRAAFKHEVNANDLEALLRGSGQLEELRQQIAQMREAGEVAHPGEPWITYEEMSHTLAFFWIAQGFTSIARALKEVDDEVDPGTRGYMPEISHEQAMVLLRQVPDFLALTHASLTDPTYDGGRSLPVPLDARVEDEGLCPAAHLRGLLRGAQYLAGYVQVEVETYCNLAGADKAPKSIKASSQRLRAELAAAQSHLLTAEQAVSPILNGESVDEVTHEMTENYLWSALKTYLLLGQSVALPSLLQDQPGGHTSPPPLKQSRSISRGDRWCLTSDLANQELKRTGRRAWAEDELAELWSNKRWKISGEEQRFLAETTALQREGAIRSDSYIAECPFNPVWTVLRSVTVAGQRLRAGSQFAYNHHSGKGQLLTGFRAVPDFEECQDDE